MVALKIPEDLAAQASLIPGLSDRVARFIKLEIVQHEQRLKRFHPETLDLVARARQNAETQRASGYDLDEIKRSFDRHLQDLSEDNL
jgi:hypothetical protein